MEEKKEVYRANVRLSADDVLLLSEIASEMGCTRGSIASYLLEDGIARLHSLPRRSRLKVVRECRELFWPMERLQVNPGGPSASEAEDDEARDRILRARGPSAGYIITVLEELLTKAKQRSRYEA